MKYDTIFTVFNHAKEQENVMSTVSIACTKAQINDILQRYPMAEKRKTPAYALWQIKLSDCVITAYESGKVVFQGDGAEFHAASYQPKSSKSLKKNPQIGYPQCGSDEVGTGDYFGPVCVCAAYVDENNAKWLTSLGIQDSKAMKDETILAIGAQLMERLPHSILILDNQTYNKVHEEHNMVAIKCKLHNQAFVHLKHKLNKLPKYIIVDQFVKGDSYYRYLKQEAEVIQSIHFETKAENKYLAVAAASVIARYAFLKRFDAMCQAYAFPFLKGASLKVDQCIVDFVQLHGKEALSKVAKLHFANTKKAGF